MRQTIKYIKGLNAVKITNFIFVIICLVASFYLMCGNVILSSSPLDSMNFYCCLGVFLADIVCLILLIFLNAYRNHYRPSIPLLVGLTTIFLSNFVTLIVFSQTTHLQHTMPDGRINDIVYILTLEDKLAYIFQFFGVLIAAFLIIDLIPKNINGLSTIYVLCFAIMLMAFVTLIYSYVIEPEYYTTFFFKIMHKDENFNFAKSYLPNKNSFAIVLFMGMIASLFMQQRKGHWWWFIPATYLLLAILMTFCKALIIVAPVFFFAFLLYRGILTIKRHVFRNIVVSFCVLAIIGCFAALIINANSIIPGFYDYLYKIFIKSGDDTFESRLELWKGTIELLNKFNWFSGVGFHNAEALLFQYMGISVVPGGFASIQTHNVGLQMLLNGGGFFALFFLLAFLMIIVLSVRVFKENKSLVLFSLILTVCMLGYGVVESGSFILPATCDFVFISTLIYVPLVYLFHRKKTEIIEIEKDCIAR